MRRDCLQHDNIWIEKDLVMTTDVKTLKSRNFYLEPPYLYLLNPDMLPFRNILQ